MAVCHDSVFRINGLGFTDFRFFLELRKDEKTVASSPLCLLSPVRLVLNYVLISMSSWYVKCMSCRDCSAVLDGA